MSETITNFLLARITEDETVARAAAESVNEHAPRYAADEYAYDEPLGSSWAATDYGMVRGENLDLWDCEGSETLCTTPAAATHMAHHDPARVLAECTAKRTIVEVHQSYFAKDSVCMTCREIFNDDSEDYPCKTIRALSAVYADHPDYQQGWAL